MTYWERPSGTLGAVLWARTVGPAPERARILPDGCMDLIWDGSSPFIAGPDSAARWVHSAADTSYFALRFSSGTGPALLGYRRTRCSTSRRPWSASGLPGRPVCWPNGWPPVRWRRWKGGQPNAPRPAPPIRSARESWRWPQLERPWPPSRTS
jgi:hypothetical protein